MAGTTGSFFAGLLISAVFSPIVAIIVGLVWDNKRSSAYWFGALLGLIVLGILIISFGLLNWILGGSPINIPNPFG